MSRQRFRDKHICVMVTEQEKMLIAEKMQQAKESNLGNYMRRMALQGYVLNVDMGGFRDYAAQISKVGNNINQIAKVVNSEYVVYKADMDRILSLMQEMEQSVNECMKIFLHTEENSGGNHED